MRGEIRALQRRLGVTTIMVTHDQEEALSMADRVVVMNHGVIEQVGTPLEVYEQPATPFVADFLGKVNVLQAVCIGGGRYRVGQVELLDARERRRERHEPCGSTCGRKTACWPIPDRSNRCRTRCRGHVRHVDFLGTYCLANVEVDGFDGQRMLVYFSLNQALELGVPRRRAICRSRCAATACASSSE